MFNNLMKLTKILTRKNSVQFISVGVWAVLRFLVIIKNLGQYKNLPGDKFVEKKGTFCKAVLSIQTFLDLSLVNDLVDFLELLIFINVCLP